MLREKPCRLREHPTHNQILETSTHIVFRDCINQIGAFFGVCTYLGSLSFVCCEKNSENILNGQHSKEGRKMSKQLRPTTNVDGWIRVYVVSERGQTTGRRNRVYERVKSGEEEEWEIKINNTTKQDATTSPSQRRNRHEIRQRRINDRYNNNEGGKVTKETIRRWTILGFSLRNTKHRGLFIVPRPLHSIPVNFS